MAQTRVLQRRIRSVKNAKQITKALEVVAASRMRKVLDFVEGARTYGQIAASIISRITSSAESKTHPLFSPDQSQPPLYVIFTSDRGQAGAFNSNIFNLSLKSFQEEKGRPQVYVFGRKGTRYFSRLADIDLKGAYEDIPDAPDVNVFSGLLSDMLTAIEQRQVGKIIFIYTEFISSLTQKAKLSQLMPVEPSETESADNKVYEFEPDISEVLDEAIRLYLESRLMQARIESAASEHAMRMVAMGNANRNANDLIDSLTLELNATRQAAITQEIAEITGGAAAIAA
jgi:F-type H+-transporting ATPase subunit gamma